MSGLDETCILDNIPRFVDCDLYDGNSKHPYRKHGCWFCACLKYLSVSELDEEVDFGDKYCEMGYKIAKIIIQEYNNESKRVRFDLKIFRVDRNYCGTLGRVKLEKEE
jgi:hypothetical protein